MSGVRFPPCPLLKPVTHIELRAFLLRGGKCHSPVARRVHPLYFTHLDLTRRCKERRVPQSDELNFASRRCLSIRVSHVLTDAEKSRRSPRPFYSRRDTSEIKNNEERGDIILAHCGARSNSPLSSFSATLCVLCIFALSPKVGTAPLVQLKTKAGLALFQGQATDIAMRQLRRKEKGLSLTGESS